MNQMVDMIYLLSLWFMQTR